MFNFIPTDPEQFIAIAKNMFTPLPAPGVDMKDFLERLRAVFNSDAKESKEMWETFQKASNGDASVNEIATANSQLDELLKSVRFGVFLALPGTVFILPLLLALAREYGIDLVPASVTKQFGV